jgi:hypothetical protein
MESVQFFFRHGYVISSLVEKRLRLEARGRKNRFSGVVVYAVPDEC